MTVLPRPRNCSAAALRLNAFFLKREQFYIDKKIDLRLNASVTAINRHARTVTLSTGEALAYEKVGDRDRGAGSPSDGTWR